MQFHTLKQRGLIEGGTPSHDAVRVWATFFANVFHDCPNRVAISHDGLWLYVTPPGYDDVLSFCVLDLPSFPVIAPDGSFRVGDTWLHACEMLGQFDVNAIWHAASDLRTVRDADLSGWYRVQTMGGADHFYHLPTGERVSRDRADKIVPGADPVHVCDAMDRRPLYVLGFDPDKPRTYWDRGLHVLNVAHADGPGRPLAYGVEHGGCSVGFTFRYFDEAGNFRPDAHFDLSELGRVDHIDPRLCDGWSCFAIQRRQMFANMVQPVHFATLAGGRRHLLMQVNSAGFQAGDIRGNDGTYSGYMTAV